jgi:choline dehydrogenase-like flavoprotein
MNDKATYDYVIVGAGSAGCVLASKLTEDPAVTVLLLEAGGADRDPLIHIPLGLGKMHEHRMHDWGYDTEPVPQLGGRVIEAMRGKVLGGSSSINVMAYVRGHRGDYDRWAQKGCTGWSYADILPYMRECETYEGGEDAYRGGKGPLGVETAKTADPLYDAWLKAGEDACIPFTEDYNGRQQEGFGRSQSTTKDGRRSSAAVAWLHPAMKRPNLTVETHAMASRIVMEGTRARGIAYTRKGKAKEVLAAREVILSGGVFNSPQLLMLSGIGPAEHLRDVGIEPVVDLKGVGKNLQDHMAVLLLWSRPKGGPFRDLMRFDRIARAMVQAYLFGTGPATVLPGGLHGFVRTRPELAVPDIQFLFRGTSPKAQMWFPGVKKPFDEEFGMRPVLLHPESRGEVLLRSANPADPVRIIQNFLSTETEMATLRRGVRICREVVEGAAMDGFRGVETAPGKHVQSDADIDDWIRRTTVTAHHPSCTCPMGIGEEAVLDAQMRVRGVENLRVVDASAMPDLVSGNINAAVLMLAAKAADLIAGKAPLAPAEGV